MTIDDAIKTLKWDLQDEVMPYKSVVREAEQLGIEALEVIKEVRHYPFPDGILQLPGETKD